MPFRPLFHPRSSSIVVHNGDNGDATDRSSGSTSVEDAPEAKKYVTNSKKNPDVLTWTILLNCLWCLRQTNYQHKDIPLDETTTDYHVLASLRKFEQIEKVMADANADCAYWLCQDCSFPLHHLLKFEPPLRTTSMVCEVLAEIGQRPPELVQDKYGFTPLHVASAHGCNVVVVARLVNGSTTLRISCSSSISSRNSCMSMSSMMSARHSSPFHNNSTRRKKRSLKYNPAAIKDDKYGRLPLHWACVRMHPDLENAIKVVGFLVDVYPDSVTVKDCQGETPLDILNRHRKKHPAATSVLEGIIRRTLDQQNSVIRGNIHLSSSLSFRPPAVAKTITGVPEQSKTDESQENKQVQEVKHLQDQQVLETVSTSEGTTYPMTPSSSCLSKEFEAIEALLENNFSSLQKDWNTLPKCESDNIIDPGNGPSARNAPRQKVKVVLF